MDLSQLHFSQPLWLWALFAIPLTWSLYFFCYRKEQPTFQLEKLIDKHLIPHLLVNSAIKKKKLYIHLGIWTLAWSCLALGLAGPRWDFREAPSFARDQSIAILLDLSESMNAQDITPSRLGRAKQKIEDLLNLSNGVKVGLIAFAADPHLIVPITEDKETIRHLLPSLDTDLVYVQGSKLTPALEMAAAMFENEPGNNKAIVVISDGGFEDGSAIHTAKKVAEKGIVLYTIGVGSLDGAPLKDRRGSIVKKNGSPIVSKLEKEKFQEISKIGHGRYFDADHSDQIALIIEDLKKRGDLQEEIEKSQRFWQERFYLLLLPTLPFFLIWYRRGCLFALLLFILMPNSSQAHFYNQEQQAGLAYENKDYAAAAKAFQDPYRKAVAYYRMGDYPAAEEMFRQSTRPEVASSAAYNLGNALVQQNKLKDAIAAYEDVLKKWPDHTLAQENLELVKKMLEEQESKQQNGNEDQQQKSEQQNQEQNKENPQQSSPEENSEESGEENSTTSDKSADNDQTQESSESKETSENKEAGQDEGKPQQLEEKPIASKQPHQRAEPRSQEDLNADLWLNQMKNDPKSFLKNKFYIESKKNGTKEEPNPW